MSATITQIKIAWGTFEMTAPVGTYEKSGVFKIPALASALSDNAGVEAIKNKAAMKLKATCVPADYDKEFGAPKTARPETQKTQPIAADVLMTKYKHGGACEFKKK